MDLPLPGLIKMNRQTSGSEEAFSFQGRLKGRSPFKTNLSPSPSKERGTKGVRLIKNLISLV
jgi:hypothetical protein